MTTFEHYYFYYIISFLATKKIIKFRHSSLSLKAGAFWRRFCKTGSYGHRIPVFIRRFNANWDRIEKGYFSVIGELTIRIYGRLEHLGYYLEDYASDGREIRPDVSVGKLFPKWLETKAPDKVEKYKTYMHLLPNNVEVHARQYENCVLEEFLEYVDTIWIKERAYEYFSERDPKALDFLPKMLPN